MDKGKIIIPAGRKPWPHELRVANILALAGHTVEFLAESNVHTADILLDGIEYEIKSPFTNKPDKLERNIKRGLKQSKNIIFDSSRMKNMRDYDLKRFLIRKAKEQKQIHGLLLIARNGRVIDIKLLI
ncbi:hypothetical protein IJH01_00430 [Candidatus Saccharibacteria bacterium]|nr:hypothetical protein [Candidatus Saccharibacteria bacterium]